MIGKHEFKAALLDMGYREIRDERIDELLEKADKNNNDVIKWVEFCDMMYTLIKSLQDDEEGTDKIVMKKMGSQTGHALVSDSGVIRSYRIEEVSSASRMINKVLEDIPDLQFHLPIDIDRPEDLFNTLSDGFVGLHLLNAVKEDTINLKTIHKGSNLNIFR